MTERTRWLDQTGAKGTSRVVVGVNRAGDKFVLRWWDGKKQNWSSTTLDHVVLERDRRGNITDASREAAIAAAQRKSLELVGKAVTATGAVPRKAITVGEIEALITDKDTGKYPHDEPFRRELVRALRIAVAVWGAETPLADIEESHWIMLLRRRLERLLAEGWRGSRATEITVSRLITSVRWLRSRKHIPRDAAPWPEDWKEEIAKHWRGVTKSADGPATHQPRHTLEEAKRILKASSFDPRYELLMWLGMDLRLGQVARALRSHLELTTGDVLAAGLFGRFTVKGSGKKGGTVVALTRGQRDAVDRALAGYLKDVEDQFQRGQIKDYLIFPAGYVVGRVARVRGEECALTLGKVDRTRHVQSSWIRKNFRVAEQLAGVEHQHGRGAYGLRRQGVDVGKGEKLSPYGLQALGGWSDIKIPTSIYAEQSNEAGQLEARLTRAKLRGEE